MATPDASKRQFLEQRALSTSIAQQVEVAWAGIDIRDLDGSFDRVFPTVYRSVAVGQLAAASAADGYLDRVLHEQGIDPARVGSVVPQAFSGVASDGRPLATLLREPVIAAKVALGDGLGAEKALEVSRVAAVRIAATQVTDAGRTAVAAASAGRPAVTGYTRQLSSPACARCIVLAGRIYRLNEGFARHPHCFPAGTVVSGPALEAATRRWYDGELVVFTTASGQQLALTGNHPVLTRRGWVPAHLLDEVDDVIRSTRTQGAAALEVPNHDQMPALIEDVWGAFSVGGLDRVPSSPEDFHGDGQDGEVDVVRADRPLWGHHCPTGAQHVGEQHFACRSALAAELIVKCPTQLVDLWDRRSPSGAVRGGGLCFAGVGGHLRGVRALGGASSTSFHARFQETLSYRSAGDPVAGGEFKFAGAGEVVGDQVGGRDVGVVPVQRWDAPGAAYSVETCGAYASRGADLLWRLTGQVAADRIVELRRVQWCGHVFSLSSSEGWHTANNLIVSNCQCQHVPCEITNADATTDPRSAFDRLSPADQDRYFTRAGAEAIRNGADIGQVVNSRSGMYSTADQRLVTRSSTSVRGRSPGFRPMPEQILADARTREEGIAELRRYGYLSRGVPQTARLGLVEQPAPSSGTVAGVVRRTKAAVSDADVLAEARQRNVTPERVIQLREERAERRFVERRAQAAAEKALSAEHPDVVAVAQKYGVHPDEVLTARHRVAGVRAVAREEAARVQAEAMRELDRLGVVKIKTPPRKGARTEFGSSARRGEYDWLEQVSDREKNRLSRSWYGGVEAPDQMAATMSHALGRELDVDDAVQRWLGLNRRAEASGALRRGKLPSLDAYSGAVEPNDLIGTLADDGFDAVRLFGDDLDAAGHVASVERKLTEDDAFGYLGDAARAVEGPAPYRMGFLSWEEEVRDIEFHVYEGTSSALERRRLAELVPSALDDPGLDFEELYARIVATARRAGEEVPANAVIPWA